ncbi:hemerythrin domain-containing protein [Geodermatophilus nigrescens]
MTEIQRDVVELLSADHREFDRIFRELEQLLGSTDPADLERKRALVDEVSIGLVKHSVAEETQVYPRVEAEVDAAEAERSKHEHDQAEHTMKQLERLDPTDPGYDAGIRSLITEIREHVEHEEGRMFTELKARFDHAELVRMAEQVERIKAISPTRPHPLVPNEGGIRTALGPVAALVDHLRDAVSGRGRHEA